MSTNNNDIANAINALTDTIRMQSHQSHLSNIIPIPNPTVEQLKKLVEEAQEQNKILQSQIDDAKKDGEEAKKEAKKARIFSWISFGIATAISIAALVVSIIK